jgi:anti-sigma factor RsiW
MKPCSNRRKEIASLAVGALQPRNEHALRAHLQTCEGCRHYLEELSNLTEQLGAAKMQSDVEASQAFHQKVMAALRTRETGWRAVPMQLRAALLNWRVALPLASAMVVMALVFFPRHPAAPPTAQPAIAKVKKDVEPTIANYQMLANRSLEKFDELLTRQGNRNPPPTPIYTASIRGATADLE